MGFYFRKSFTSGIFRLNLSKSGFSYSIGIKGARINTGPRGTYVNIGSNGIYYRQKISGTDTRPRVNEVQPVVLDYNNPHTITSSNIDNLTDVDSKDFINELTEKANKISYVNWFGILPLIIFLLFLFGSSFENHTTIVKPEGNRVVAIINSDVGSNIREFPNAKSKVVKVATDREEFALLDSTKGKWLKIQFGDTIGYVNKKLAIINHIKDTQQSNDELNLVNPYFYVELIFGSVFFVCLLFWLHKKDKKRFAMEIFYEMDKDMSVVYQQFAQHFLNFNTCARKWQYLHSTINNDWKRNAGAGQLINRHPIFRISSHQIPNKFLKTNVQIPYIQLRNTEFFFLPERLLIKRGNKFAAVFYNHLEISSVNSRFIEDQTVPSDAKIVDYTWKYVNKNGGPDRRFNDNRRIPICLYSQYTFRSGTGIYEIITTSKVDGFHGFTNFLLQIGCLQSKMKQDRPPAQFRNLVE
ncbi:DUF4236 domain-containing protein [Pedobacter sp.]|jgi:hypothetical protein|uniref:DUF4236 domain-containing protein n=1 Tax=Pedobacter sp. TaxID=1411316 RepID=UPI002BA02F13|nr:DUF4236 domain-containing protein [Pedobacter sp.]HWW38658.1 DUF4236 domain-containing protein [Pedobacter sp.]